MSPSLDVAVLASFRRSGAFLQRERVLKRESHPFAMTRSCFLRASRAARARDPDWRAKRESSKIIDKRHQEIKELGYEKAPRDLQAFRSHRMNTSTGGKGPGVRTVAEEQLKMNHIVSLKAKNVDSNNTEPAFLLGGFTAPMLWDRLAESSLSSNAVNSSVRA